MIIFNGRDLHACVNLRFPDCRELSPSSTIKSILIPFISPLSVAILMYSIGPQVSKLLQGDIDAIKWARLEVNALEAHEMLDDEVCPPSNIQSHLNLALLDVDDDSLSMYSVEQSVSLEDYLRGRWSRASSFD